MSSLLDADALNVFVFVDDETRLTWIGGRFTSVDCFHISDLIKRERED